MEFEKFNTNFYESKQDIKRFLELKMKQKLLTADITFLKLCQGKKVCPKFVWKTVRFNGNTASRLAAEKKVIQLEINQHFDKIRKLDLILYELNLKLKKHLGEILFRNLEENHWPILCKHFQRKKSNLKKKFKNLCNNSKVNNKKKVDTNNNNVVNLSKEKFTDDEMKILNKGLKTGISYSNKIEDYIGDVELIVQNLGEFDQQVVRKQCEDVIKDMKVNKKHNSGQNSKLASSLRNKDIVITKADKGNTVVVLDSSDYKARMENLLQGENFTEIKKSPVGTNTKKFKETLGKIGHIMKKDVKFKLYPRNPKLPTLKGLPKIHKEGKKMRPIINNIGSVTYKLAKWLVTQFQSFDKFETHNIRNSLDLVEKIRDVQLSDKDKLVSFDVVNLFPSVPKQQILKLLIKWLQEIGLKEEEIEEYRMLTELCLNETCFYVSIFQVSPFTSHQWWLLGYLYGGSLN